MNNPPLPSDKFDTGTATRLSSLAWEELAPHMPRILEWVQDPNWPVARVLMPRLATLGARPAPFVAAVLRGSDGVWKHAILTGIVAHSPALAAALPHTLQRLATEPMPEDVVEEVDRVARTILAA